MASRLLAWALGVRFDAAIVGWAWQMLDLTALRDHYWRSLWHLHSQPPLFNAFIGAMFNGFGALAPVACHGVYLALGLAFAVGGYRLLVRLGLAPWRAAALVIVFMASPAAILYEHWLFYAYPEAVALCLAALWLNRFASGGRTRDAAVFFGLLAALALTRSLYHLGWMVAALGFVLAAYRHDRRRMRAATVAFAVPFLLVLGLYAKNAALFGTFSGSSWLGMNIYKVSIVQLGPERLQAMAARGAVSPVSLVGPFESLAAYPAAYHAFSPSGDPVLDAPQRANGAPNFNHQAYLGISRQLQADAKAALWAHPAIYPKAMLQSYAVYFRPAGDFGFLGENRRRLGLWKEIYERGLNGQLLDRRWFGGARLGAELERIGLWLVVGLPLLTVFGLVAAWRAWRAGPERRAFALTLAFLVLNVLYVTGVGNGLEIGENNRFRFDVDFFFVALLGLVWERWGAARRAALAGGNPSTGLKD